MIQIHNPRNLALLLILAILTLTHTARADLDSLWTRWPTQGSPLVLDKIKIAPDGNIVIAGARFISYGGNSGRDYLVEKYTPSGALVWSRLYNGTADTSSFTVDDYAFSMVIDSLGNVYVTGRSSGPPFIFSQIATIKYDSNGDTVWVRRYGLDATKDEIGADIVVDRFGHAAVIGEVSIGSQIDIATIRYRPNGDTAWVRTYDGPGNDWDLAKGVEADDDGNVYATCASWGGAQYDFTTIKYDSLGSPQWTTTYNAGGAIYDGPSDIGISPAGDVYAVGRSNSIPLIIKYTAAGDTAWTRMFPFGSGEYDQLAFDSSGHTIVAGYAADANGGDIIVAKYLPNGDTVWTRMLSGPGIETDRAYSVAIGTSDEIWVAGSARYTTDEAVVLHYASNGTLLDQFNFDGNPSGIDAGIDIAVGASDTVYVVGRSFEGINNQLYIMALASGTGGPNPVLHVTTTDDAGGGSLREAISTANATSGDDAIVFDLAGTIFLATPLPAISDGTGGLFIDGSTAPGDPIPGVPLVAIDGGSVSSGHGFEISSSNNWINSVAIRNFPGDGIRVTSGTQNEFSDNLIYNNGGLGIDLGGDGVTDNDVGDGDTGANDLVNAPVIDSVYLIGSSEFRIVGTAPNDASVQLYLAERYLGQDTMADPSQHGEGWEILDSQTASATGQFVFPSVSAPYWARLSAIATDPSGNTSEFGPNRRLIPDSLTFTTYSPVTLTVVTPDSADSIGPGFNTIGPDATYDSLTDYGIGPNNVPGELDDRVVITNVEEGTYQIKIKTDPGGTGNYFFGIRVDGTNEVWGDVGTGTLSSSPISNPVPPSGQTAVFLFNPAPYARGDFDGDGLLTALDLNAQIDMLFFAAPLPNPEALADLNCDAFPDALDLNYMIDHLFFSGPPPCF